ncbi:MAG TPA: type II secretion system F family protein [Candidatus Krumholzibacteria bacterium]|nr:type II secretion system F family protein [Candidatus Krumholzibacteria bacterium]
MSTLLLIPVLTAAAILALAAAVYSLRFRNATIHDRLHRMVNADEALVTGNVAKSNDSIFDSAIPAWMQPLAALGWLLPTQVYSETLKWELAQAGYRHLEARRIFAGIRVLTTVTLSLATLLIGLSRGMPADQLLLVAVAATALGYLGPMMLVRARQSSRQMAITLSLPDALDLLVICVEAGQGLNAALMKVGKEIGYSSPALSEDLMIVNNEMRAGVSRTQALRNLSLRTGSDDVRSLVAVLIQSDRFGTSVAQALRIHSDSLRTKRRQRAEERARKAPIKLMFPLVFCIFPEMFVVLLAPGMIQLFHALSQSQQ